VQMRLLGLVWGSIAWKPAWAEGGAYPCATFNWGKCGRRRDLLFERGRLHPHLNPLPEGEEKTSGVIEYCCSRCAVPSPSGRRL